MKEIKNKIILISLLLINACAVSTQPVVKEINKKDIISTKPSNSPAPMISVKPSPEIKTEESISPEKDPELNPQSSVNASSIPTPSPTDDRSTSASYTTPSNSDYENGRPTPPPYTIPKATKYENYPVEEGLQRAFINLIFKDEYKVRFDSKKKEFYSLIGSDLTNINNLINEYSITIIGSVRGDHTEEELSKIEKESEEFWGVDVANRASIYDMLTEDNVEINVKELIEKLRLDPLVRTANQGGGLGTTA